MGERATGDRIPRRVAGEAATCPADDLRRTEQPDGDVVAERPRGDEQGVEDGALRARPVELDQRPRESATGLAAGFTAHFQQVLLDEESVVRRRTDRVQIRNHGGAGPLRLGFHCAAHLLADLRQSRAEAHGDLALEIRQLIRKSHAQVLQPFVQEFEPLETYIIETDAPRVKPQSRRKVNFGKGLGRAVKRRQGGLLTAPVRRSRITSPSACGP